MEIEIETGDKVPKTGCYKCLETGEEMDMDAGETCRGYYNKTKDPSTSAEIATGDIQHGHFEFIRKIE